MQHRTTEATDGDPAPVAKSGRVQTSVAKTAVVRARVMGGAYRNPSLGIHRRLRLPTRPIALTECFGRAAIPVVDRTRRNAMRCTREEFDSGPRRRQRPRRPTRSQKNTSNHDHQPNQAHSLMHRSPSPLVVARTLGVTVNNKHYRSALRALAESSRWVARHRCIAMLKGVSFYELDKAELVQKGRA